MARPHRPSPAARDVTGPATAAVPAWAEAAVRRLEASEQALARLSPVVVPLLTEVVSLSQRLEQWLDALTADLRAPQGNLDRYGGNVEAAHGRLLATVGTSPDVILRRFGIGRTLRWPALLAFVDGLVDAAMIDRDVLGPLQSAEALPVHDPQSLLNAVQERVVAVGHVTVENVWDQLLTKLVSGNALLFLEGVPEALVLDTVKYPQRSVGRSQTEPSVLGPQEAFTEISLTQMNLLRLRIQSPGLRFTPLTVGNRSLTQVVLVHLDDVTNPALVSAVLQRLRTIRRDSVQTANEVAEYLADRRWTLFPQTRQTDRVEWVAREVMTGKVAVLVANDPFAIILPNTLMDFYRTTQDYASSFWDTTLTRIVRLVALFVGIYLMPLYIALTSVNTDLIPTKLLLTIAGSRAGIPFPPISEVIIMWVIIEVLREASVRLPQQMATTLGTVGAVVVGTAIVKAGVVDDIMIVTVTLTALGLFTSPAFELTSTWRWLFWGFIAAAYVFGIYGIVLMTVAVLTHVTSLENYGVPYFSPWGPLRVRELADSLVRLPLPFLTRRPLSLRTVDARLSHRRTTRQAVDLYAGQRRARRR
ncbi:MAG: spore germination protein [Firmicutes bacterium]|nr:spore germination protein [Alicyclobacillaceae bacterium]MCL6497823.1 spore germination protein [Bacillota bacterium]